MPYLHPSAGRVEPICTMTSSPKCFCRQGKSHKRLTGRPGKANLAANGVCYIFILYVGVPNTLAYRKEEMGVAMVYLMAIFPWTGHAPLTHGKQYWSPCGIEGIPHRLISLAHRHLQQQVNTISGMKVLLLKVKPQLGPVLTGQVLPASISPVLEGWRSNYHTSKNPRPTLQRPLHHPPHAPNWPRTLHRSCCQHHCTHPASGLQTFAHLSRKAQVSHPHG